jgi:hypothetical protein
MAPGEPRDGEAVSWELVLALRGQRRCRRIASHYVGTSKVGILPCCPTSRSSLPAAHCVTPETELTSHYFVSSARNMRRDDPEVDRYPNDGM